MKVSAAFSLFILFLLTVISPLCVQSQHLKTEPAFSVWGGYSFNSIKFLGKTKNSQTQILSFGYQKQLKRFPNNKMLWYTADLIPYIHFRYPKRDEENRIVERSGFGLSPVGFLITEPSSSKLSPFFRTTGGLIFMENNFPTDDARKLNFTFDITFGANFRFNSFGMISFGYKFHHISNAETGDENPGLDSNFLFLKLSTY